MSHPHSIEEWLRSLLPPPEKPEDIVLQKVDNDGNVLQSWILKDAYLKDVHVEVLSEGVDATGMPFDIVTLSLREDEE